MPFASRVGFFAFSISAALVSSAVESPQTVENRPWKRWAILASAELQKNGLADLLAAELSTAKGIELVERNQLRNITDEETLQAFTADQASTRLQLGRLLKADVLLLLTHAKADRHERVQLVVCDCISGARLVVDELPFEPASLEKLSDLIAERVKGVRERFPNGVEFVIGVPPFMSHDIARDHDDLKLTFARVLQGALVTAPGIAVIEIEEAQAVRREAELGGVARVRRLVPVIAEGEYETARSEGKDALLVSLDVRLSDGKQTLRTLHRRQCPLPAAGEWIGKVLAENLLGESFKNYKPLNADQQFVFLTARADSFSQVGDWNEASSLRESALLLRPDSGDQRQAMVRDYNGLWNDEANDFSLPNAVENARIAHHKDLAEWQAARLMRWERSISHFDWLLRNHRLGFDEADRLAFHEQIPLMLSELTPVEGRPANRAVLRDYLLNTYPEILRIDAPANSEGNQLRKLEWSQNLFAMLMYPGTRVREQADLDLILETIDRIVPDDTPVSQPLLDFACLSRTRGNQHAGAGDEAVEKFLLKLKLRTDKPQIACAAAYGLLFDRALDWPDEELPDSMKKESAELIKKMFSALPNDGAGDILRENVLSKNVMARLGGKSRSDYGSGPARPTPPALPPPVAAGPVSWEVIPVKFRGRSGSLSPLRANQFPTNRFANEGLHARRSGSGPDVILGPGVVLLQTEDGIVRPVLDDPDGGFEDVAWDGAHLWVSSRSYGLILLDKSGLEIARFGVKDGNLRGRLFRTSGARLVRDRHPGRRWLPPSYASQGDSPD